MFKLQKKKNEKALKTWDVSERLYWAGASPQESSIWATDIPLAFSTLHKSKKGFQCKKFKLDVAYIGWRHSPQGGDVAHR